MKILDKKIIHLFAVAALLSLAGCASIESAGTTALTDANKLATDIITIAPTVTTDTATLVTDIVTIAKPVQAATAPQTAAPAAGLMPAPAKPSSS